MADQSQAFKRRLSKVRRRWKAAAVLGGALLVATEAVGLFLVFMLADAIYGLSGEVRLAMLAAAAVLLTVLFVRHVARPILRSIPDEQIALYIEERSAQAEGSVISALECQRQPRGGLGRFIAALLVNDAVHRIDRTNLWALSNLGRLKKHLLVAGGLLAVFAVTSVSFPQYTRRKGERIITPWVSILRERQDAHLRQEARLAELRRINQPIEIDVQPKGMTILRGKGIEFAAVLSREPAARPVFRYQFAGGKEQAIEMEKDQARFGYRLPFRDINESFGYYVTVGPQASGKYQIKVHDPLAVRGIELTYHWPDYLQRDPQRTCGTSGDVTALAGTRVDVRVVANNPLKSGTLRFADQKSLAMKAGPQAQDGAAASFSVEKDGSYTYEVTDIYGETHKLEDFYFVKAVPDRPPTITMVSPKVDMSVHPLCEMTFAAKVADDYAIRDAMVRATYYRDGKGQPMPLAMRPARQEDFRNFLAGRAEHVLELEKLTPAPKVGDMIFYYMEITDRKGQAARTDLFFVKLTPFEVAAAWPAEVSPPDLPHWDYLWTPDIILLAAAAWHIEQQRGTIPTSEFQAKCTQLAGRMEPAMNSQNGLNLLGGKQKLPKHILAAAGEVLAMANRKLDGALQLLREFEPGKAALEMQQAMALAESLNTEKALQELEMAQTPIHTGQPSGGYNQDAVMEQAEFRLPGVMSDSLTAFQQEDNPRHFLPPDYRRALRLKERTAPLTKELKLAGEIYASQEQLLEMAREQFGHRKLREAAEMSCTNDPAAGSGTKAQIIRVDKRAVPWSSMDPNAPLPQEGNRGQMKQPKVEKVKGLKYARLTDNERAGPGSPHRSQTPGGGAGGDEDEQDRRPDKKKSYYDDQWKVEANDRRPRRSQGGGGGGGSQQQRPSQAGMEPLDQQPSGGSSASGAEGQLAARQAALAERAAQLARGLSSDIEPGDTMGQRAAGELREASRGMRQAAASFQRGDLGTGIAQARRAQQALRTAMHGMRAAEYGTLGEALAAAQQGAAALTQNQYRISQGTERLEHRVRELGGETAAGTPGAGQPGQGQPGEGQPGQGQPGEGQPGQGQPGQAAPGKGQPGQGQAGKGEPGRGRPGEGQPGKAEPGKGWPGQGQPGKGQPGQGQPGSGSAVLTAGGAPGAGRPGEGRPAGTQPAAGPSLAAVEKAKAHDPRIAANMQSLAGEQLKLSESLKDFEAYVSDLTKWSDEAQKDRVTTSLRDVTEGLRQEGVAQKMVDAGVDLSQQDIGSARATQTEIEASLGDMTTRLREAGDMLAGSKTGILSRTARQAKEVGSEVRRLAGLPPPGGPQQPGAGQPGQGQPAQGQATQGQPGQGQPGQGQPTQGQPGQGQPGRWQPGQPEDSLARRLAAEEQGRMAVSSTPGRPGPGANVPGGAGSARDEIGELWFKARDLAETLRDEQLAEQPTLDYLGRRVKDPQAFRQMFDKVKKAEAGKFSDVVTGIGKSLDEVLKETLAAKKLHSEQGEECPHQYRSFVNAYFEALSKVATAKPTD
jgi:hypothetical protein